METKPKTKMQMVREYLAEHPNAKTKEVTEELAAAAALVN